MVITLPHTKFVWYFSCLLNKHNTVLHEICPVTWFYAKCLSIMVRVSGDEESGVCVEENACENIENSSCAIIMVAGGPQKTGITPLLRFSIEERIWHRKGMKAKVTVNKCCTYATMIVGGKRILVTEGGRTIKTAGGTISYGKALFNAPDYRFSKLLYDSEVVDTFTKQWEGMKSCID